MKRMCQGSACLTCIRAAVAAALVLLTLSSCLRGWDRKRKPLLTAPGEVEFDGYVAVLEEFKDTYIFEAVAFGQDGIGYGVTGTYSSRRDYDPYKSLLLKTEDGGRTWHPTGKRMRGRCSEMRLLDGSLYLLMHQDEPRRSAILKCDQQDGYKLRQLSRFGSRRDVYKLHVLNDSTFACGMRFWERSEDGKVSSSDSVMVSRDSGRTWEDMSLPGKFSSFPYLTFDGNRAFVTLYDGAGENFMFVKDIMTGKKTELSLPRYFYAAIASGDLIAADPQIGFWRCGEKHLQRVSAFGWNRGRAMYYIPKYLHKQGNLVICIGDQFPTYSDGKTSCAFASVDGGEHWCALVMGDEISGPMATTSAPDGSISVFFTGSHNRILGYKHCILTLKKKQNPVQDTIGLTDTK